MYQHAPRGYDCPFCKFSKKEETPQNKLQDIVYEDEKSMAFISPKMWPNNGGNVIIMPKKHYENIYDITDNLLAHVNIAAKKVATAMKKAYGCNGISTRQHNEPGGMQDIFHFHLHVFPRYENDKLYENTPNFYMPTQEEKDKYSSLLRKFLT